MEYRILGKTGLKISRLGFGGIPIQKIDAEGTKPLIKKLADEGVNYIDTARGYTVSEESVTASCWQPRVWPAPRRVWSRILPLV